MYSSAIDSWTRCRPEAMQIWPWWKKVPNAPQDVAFSMSASSSTMKELLPPSSSATRFRLPPASAPTARTGSGGAREGHHPDLRRLADRLARLDSAGEDLEDVLRHPGLLEGAGEGQSAADRRMRIALEQDRVAERQRRRHRAHREDHREVPWRDHADHSDRQPLRHAEPALLVGEHLADRARRSGRRPRGAPSPPRRPRRQPSGGRRRPRGSATTRSPPARSRARRRRH